MDNFGFLSMHLRAVEFKGFWKLMRSSCRFKVFEKSGTTPSMPCCEETQCGDDQMTEECVDDDLEIITGCRNDPCPARTPRSAKGRSLYPLRPSARKAFG